LRITFGAKAAVPALVLEPCRDGAEAAAFVAFSLLCGRRTADDGDDDAIVVSAGLVRFSGSVDAAATVNTALRYPLEVDRVSGCAEADDSLIAGAVPVTVPVFVSTVD
jgi:hypothetical protein